MRTTLEIEDDILVAAKELARRDGTTAGQVISDLVRRALTQRAAPAAPDEEERAEKFGFRPFPARGGVVGNEQVDALRDQDGV